MIKKRKSLKDLHHASEHIDNAMTSLAFAENIIIKAIKRESRIRRKDDKKNTT